MNMKKRIFGIALFLILPVILLAGVVPAPSVSIYLDLEIRPAPGLNYPAEDIKKDLIAGLEKGFGNKGILVVDSKKRGDFILSGTIAVKHFMKSSKSFSILFKAKRLKIESVKYRGFVPALVYDPFTSRDRTGGVKPAQDMDDAVDSSLEDLLHMMKEYGIYSFSRHPWFARIIKTRPEDLDDIKTKIELEQMADRIIKELKEAMNAALNAKLKGLTFPQPRDYSKEFKRIMGEIKALKRKVAKIPIKPVTSLPHGTAAPSLESIKKLLKDKLAGIDKLTTVNIASIIIETDTVDAGLPSTFEAVILPDQPCPECTETRIDAVNLGRLFSEKDFEKYAQEETYRIAFPMKGKMVKESGGKRKIVVSRSDYKRIFEIDRNGRLPAGTILESIKDKSKVYPRILVKVGK